MSRSVPRLATYPTSSAPKSRRDFETQLCLFDLRPVYRLVCLPTSGLHGNAFRRVVRSVKPTIVLDTRKFPTFDMTDLGRAATFHIFEASQCPYVHRHLKLSSPADPRGRWELRATATQIVSEVVADRLSAGFSMIVLLHARQDIDVLDGALRHSDADRGCTFVVEPPDSYDFAPPQRTF